MAQNMHMEVDSTDSSGRLATKSRVEPICIITVDTSDTVINVAGARQAALQRSISGTSLASFLSASQTTLFREAMDAVRLYGGTRNVRWSSMGSAFPGDPQISGRRIAKILPSCADEKSTNSLVIVLMHDIDESETDERHILKHKLSLVSDQLFQSEKMAALGQLAAGVAHEINNPIGFVFSNLGTLAGYVRDLTRIVDEVDTSPNIDRLRAIKSTIDYKFIREDVESLIRESEDGIDRITRIISALKDFTRKDDDVFRMADIRRGIETTLKVVNSELKYKADVILELGEIPEISCVPSQINQVIMNLLVNAAQSMEEFGKIVIRTGSERNMIWFEVDDNGAGMSQEIQSRIYEPFFTTKPAGKGTGLGLAISFNIIQKHNGIIDLSSAPGMGTRFRVWLPILQNDQTHASTEAQPVQGGTP